MENLDAEIAAVLEHHEREQAKRPKRVDKSDKGDAMHKAITRVFERVERQAELDRGDVRIEVFEC
jgi:hypothetical protein